mgnify:CR=1 FL=1
MTQSRRSSLTESLVNIAVGSVISWLLAYYILPIWGIAQSAKSATQVTLIYTIASVIRSYVIRRMFNRWAV